MNELISHKAVYRTAPATPGLLKSMTGKYLPEGRFSESLNSLYLMICATCKIASENVSTYKKFFDSERLRAIMASLIQANINKKAYRCWFRMNETTVISVDTPVGKTEKATVHEIVPQGSGGAALASALDLALGLKRYFAGSLDELCYGCVRTQPQAWQDDILRVAENIQSTRAGNAKLSTMSVEKGLKAHESKTTFVIVGEEKYRKAMEQEIVASPVMFGSMRCQPSISEVYLGEVIHAQGLEDGLEATIDSRLGKVRGATFKAKAMIEDFKLQAIAGMEGAWILWERAIIQTLLSGCGGWIGASKRIYNKIDEIQNEYLRMIYSCPPTTPKPALRSQAGMLNSKHRVWQEKVCVVARILHTRPRELCKRNTYRTDEAGVGGPDDRSSRDLPAGWTARCTQPVHRKEEGGGSYGESPPHRDTKRNGASKQNEWY